jgi:uncharacterized surface protein with fasciclin (FAS1) repeats
MKGSLNRSVRVASLAAAVALVLSLSLGTCARPKTASQDIVDKAVAAGSFKTLAAALQAAGLVDTLKGKGPFTVFAPTDEAFAKLPPGTLVDLLQSENKEKLVAILTYHVLPGRDLASQVVKMTSARTVNGQSCSLAAGAHVAEDIPQQIADAQRSFPQVKIELLQPIGEHPRVKKLFWEIACNYARTELQD